ncbi:hypothetical protein VNI00_007289 [Paramarasmius palmivorus]|uniref:Uncharacterized protein n=1 Tax=Paramarasmius palmivorus TaxID=297713 RepID=A0AAW0D587_9AGAR
MTVHGDVIISCGRETAVVERTMYDQFREVILGDIIMIKELYSQEFSQYDWKWKNGSIIARHRSHRGRRTIYSVAIMDKNVTFTAMKYKGEDSFSAWKDDFRFFSRTRTPDTFQLFALNKDVPLLIFHGDMVPLAHFYKPQFWSSLYLSQLIPAKGWVEQKVWIDSRGNLCTGPLGPSVDVEGGVFYRKSILGLPEEASTLMERNQGLLRFKVDLNEPPIGGPIVIFDVQIPFREVWLSQASSIFNALEISQNKHDYFIVTEPSSLLTALRFERHHSNGAFSMRRDIEPDQPKQSYVYLFVRPYPVSILAGKAWHLNPCYWSYDESGKSEMSAKEYKRLDLPRVVADPWSTPRICAWSDEVYKAIRDWQVERGFDPISSDWAKSMGYPEMEIIGPTRDVRFEDPEDELNIPGAWID